VVLDTQENNTSSLDILQTAEKSGKLFLVSVPIGNDNDISQRAIDTLKSVDLVLCEEYKEAKKILRLIGIDKPLLALNEHTEKLEAESIISSLLSGKNIALISDHGTPLLEDPGKIVVGQAISKNIKITTVPGASSIISALILSGFETKKFMYCGLLPVHKEERNQELNNLKNIQCTTILLDTPYRLIGLLESVMQVMGNNREVSLAIDLTMDTEKIFRGKICDVIASVQKTGIKKSEFVLVVKGNDIGRKHTKQNSKSFRH
jgi:16S rRNA (cytidine1402-2'-O)-methyltransferase